MTKADQPDNTALAAATGAEAERWWWDEVGVLVEHEVWHLTRLADEQDEPVRQ
ncbi:MAG: hypothetical protein VW600_04030 [Ferrovibrio sp.]